MGNSFPPHYVRFARALALVSVALPMPIVTVLGATACSSSTTPVQGSQAYQQDSGIAPAPGVMGGGSNPGPPLDSGDDSSVAEAGGGIQAMDAGPGDAADDGGGPHRGTPELPASFLALLA